MGLEALQYTTQIMIHFVITNDLLILNFKWEQRLKNLQDYEFEIGKCNLIPYDLNRYPNDLKLHFYSAEEKVRKLKPDFKGFKKARQAIDDLSKAAAAATKNLSNRLNDTNLTSSEIKFLNRQLIALEKSFIDQKGMYYGDWFKSIYVSSDPFSGYASWILPGIEYELAIKRMKKLKEWDNRYAKAIAELAQKMSKME